MSAVPVILTTGSPTELETLGYLPPILKTIEDLPAYKKNRLALDGWIQKLPGLRTPRELDGSGGTPPGSHQLRHSSVALERRHNFLSWGMGVQKTATSILMILGTYGHQLFSNIADWDHWSGLTLDEFNEHAELALCGSSSLPPGSIHIVCPRNVRKKVWMRELERMNLAWAAEVIHNEKQMMASTSPIWIYHFDLPKEQSFSGKFSKKAGGGIRLKPGGGTYFRGIPLAKVIAKRFAPSFLIVDEIHRLRAGSERTRDMRIIRRKAKRVLGLTGTPMDGWVHQAATVFGFIYGPNTPAYPFGDEEFARRFTRRKSVNLDFATGKETVAKDKPVPGIAHNQIPAFIKATRHLMHRLSLSDPEVKANVKFPRVERHKVLVPLDFRHGVFYKDIHFQGLANIKAALSESAGFKQRANVMTLMIMLRQASSAPWAISYLGPDTALINQVKAIMDKVVPEGRKVLIGTQFVDESRYIHDALAKAGYKGVRLYSRDESATKKSLKPEQQEDLIEQFTDDPECVYMISNKVLVAEGLNLAETASVTISCSHGYRANVEDQWEARVARPGQSWTHVDAYTLLNDNTIDLYIYQMLMAKVAASASLLDLDFSVESEGLGVTIDPVELARHLAEAKTIVEAA